MTDREKVIQWLETCSVGCEEGCPYEYVECKADLMRDAAELLKEQEPRVLTLKEVQNDCPDYVYLEWLNFCVCCIKDEGESNKSAGYFAYGIEDYCRLIWDTYGILWRCWTSMPTEEQRKAVKWDA